MKDLLMKKTYATVILPLLATLLFSSCQTVYYETMEKVGVHKRDIMVDRVKSARDAQEGAKQEFKDALEQFTEVMGFDGGSLEKKYKKLNKAFERSEEQATEVHARIDKVESVAKALFKEWRAELKQYSNQELRRASQDQYDETHEKYEGLIDTMNEAASKMDPVLDAFRDQVLFLKHNLNARAIARIKEMEASIAEADAFIKDLGVG
jgi:hypothetical protein